MLLIALALLIIATAAAVPKLSQEIRREREIEMIHRGVQYSRAIKRYYKKFGRYPASLEQLENTNNVRFLRKAYKDPMTEGGKWKMVRYGDVALGQAGSGTPGGGGTPGALPPVVGGPLGQPSGSGDSSQGGQNTGGGTQPQPAGSGFSLGAGSNNGVFGGGPIIGVASMSNKLGIHEFNNKAKYSQWLFLYDPTQDRGGTITGPYNPKAYMNTPQGVTPVGQPPGSPGSGPALNPNPTPGGSPGVPVPQPPPAQPQ